MPPKRILHATQSILDRAAPESVSPLPRIPSSETLKVTCSWGFVPNEIWDCKLYPYGVCAYMNDDMLDSNQVALTVVVRIISASNHSST